MVGLGTLVNSGAILAGAGAGLLLRRGLPEKWQESIMQGVALCIIVIGVQMAFKSENIMVVIFSIVLGAIVGEGIDIDTKLQRFGDWIGSKLIGGHESYWRRFCCCQPDLLCRRNGHYRQFAGWIKR